METGLKVECKWRNDTHLPLCSFTLADTPPHPITLKLMSLFRHIVGRKKKLIMFYNFLHGWRCDEKQKNSDADFSTYPHQPQVQGINEHFCASPVHHHAAEWSSQFLWNCHYSCQCQNPSRAISPVNWHGSSVIPSIFMFIFRDGAYLLYRDRVSHSLVLHVLTMEE